MIEIRKIDIKEAQHFKGISFEKVKENVSKRAIKETEQIFSF